MILDNFPLVIEISFLVLAVIACTSSRGKAMILLSAFAATACMMQVVWSVGSLIGKYTPDRPSVLFFYILSYTGMCFLLVLLFFIQAPASVLLGSFFALVGIVLIGKGAYRKTGEKPEWTAGWVMIVIGQFIFVSSTGVFLPRPKWSLLCVVGAFVACAALYVYRLYDFYNRKRSLINEK